MSRTPTQSCWSFLKLCRIGSRSSAAAAELGERPREASRAMGSLSSTRLSISPSIMPGLLVRMPGQVRRCRRRARRTAAATGGLKLNSSQSTPLPPSESLTLSRFTSVESGSGVAAMALSKLRGDGGQEVPAAARGEEADLLLAQRHQVAVGLLHVAEAVLAQHLDDLLLGRVGVEHQVDLGLGRRRR